MPFFTRPELIDEQFKQLAGTSLTLSGTTNFAGILQSKGVEIDATITGSSALVNGYVLTYNDTLGRIVLEQSTSGGTGFYNLASPSTITVGGIPAGTTLTGKPLEQLWEDLLVVYQEPAFSTFNNSIPPLSEVGNPATWNISPDTTFNWNTSNSGNVQPNSIEIIDVTLGNVTMASGLANDGTEDLPLTFQIVNNVPVTYTWGVKGTNTETNPISQKNYTINTIYPWFYGKVSSGGAPSGGNRPDPNNSVVAQSLIDSGVVIVASSNGTVVVNNFTATPDDYIWFAIPSTSTSKLVWYVNALDNGSIGGAVSPAGNLFPTPALVNVDSPSAYWNGVQYKIYLSNKQVNSTYMEFRNS